MRFGSTALTKGPPHGVLAQLVERLLCKQNVRGSSPLDSIGTYGAIFVKFYCGCNSVVEWLPSKQFVVGSSPINRLNTSVFYNQRHLLFANAECREMWQSLV